jgi:predicted regulator of Ras-like GTPase activity (Roadblock/LC7/MglB family)
MIATANASAAIQDLRSRIEGVAVALVARDGQVLFADMPTGTYAETFAIMCATALGAAVAAASELNRTPPERIVVDGGGAKTVIVGAGRNAILVAVTEPDVDTDRILSEVTKFADWFRGN